MMDRLMRTPNSITSITVPRHGDGQHCEALGNASPYWTLRVPVHIVYDI
jgi:hypothetical protein